MLGANPPLYCCCLKKNLNVPRPSDVVFVVVVVADSNIQCIALQTEETTVTQQVSHTPIKCQSRSWPQRGTKVNGSHHGSNPLLRPTGIQIATKFLLGPTNREHRKLIGIETIFLGTNYSFFCLECCQYFRI